MNNMDFALRNIIQIQNGGLWDWQDYVEYSPHSYQMRMLLVNLERQRLLA